jgi:phosphoglycerate-specific signal transduction histidine kinase
MDLSDEQRKLYEKVLAESRVEMDDLDRQIEEELTKVKERIAELQEAKNASRHAYDAACLRLGIPNDLQD